MTPKWDLIGLGGDLGDFWFVVEPIKQFKLCLILLILNQRYTTV